MDHDDESEEIRRRMAALRTEMAGNVQGVSDSARAMSDWRFYVRRFPFAAAGLAVAAGYLLVPKRSQVLVPDADALAALAKANQVWVKTGSPQPTEQRPGLMGGLVALAASGVGRMAMNWATQQFKASLAAAATNYAQQHTAAQEEKVDPVAAVEATEHVVREPMEEEEPDSPLPHSHRYPPR